MTPQIVIRILSLATLASNVFVAVFLIYILLRKSGMKIAAIDDFINLLTKKSVILSFVVALVATLGSLYLSEIAKFEPCKLCWLQRIFMYPLVFVLGTSLIKKTKDVAQYVLPLSITGLLIAAYHYYLQVNPEALAPCTSVGYSVSCSDRFVTNFGYITIPWMSLSAFFLITVGMILLNRGGKFGGRK